MTTPTHAPDCTGCPRCTAQFAGLLRDDRAGRFAVLAGKLTAMTAEHTRQLRVTAKHSIHRALAALNFVPPPPDINAAIRALKRTTPKTRDRSAVIRASRKAQAETLRAALGNGIAPPRASSILPRAAACGCLHVPAPPSLNDAVKAAQKRTTT